MISNPAGRLAGLRFKFVSNPRKAVKVPFIPRNPMKKNDEATKKRVRLGLLTHPQKHKSQSSAFGRLAFITPIYIFR